MKIEKVNEHQIRCTLTSEDLADRELKISELAYGTEKTKNLFRDMMQQAAYEFGFEAEDIPLMIEAIPLNGECIVLIVTKVEDPEELDTRFSKFAPSVHADSDDEDDESESDEDLLEAFAESADEMLNLFRQMDRQSESYAQAAPASPKAAPAQPALIKEKKQLFSFPSLRVFINAAHVLTAFYHGKNSLYKDKVSGSYLWVLDIEVMSAEDYQKLLLVIAEYGKQEPLSQAVTAYLDEHHELILKDNAIQTLATI